MLRRSVGILVLFLGFCAPVLGQSAGDQQPTPKHVRPGAKAKVAPAKSAHARHPKSKAAKAEAAKKQRIQQTIQSHVMHHVPPPGHEGQERSDWFFRRRAWPNATIDPDAYPNALAQAEKIPIYHAGGKYSTLSANTWQCIGPYSIDGRATCIATHPTDSNTFYVGAASGGLWKTTDHGSSWRCVNDTFGSLPTGCVTIDPTQPETIYLGMGETNGSADSYPGNGLWKTTNGGNSWTYLGFAKSQYIAKILLDPRDHNSVFLAVPGNGTTSDTNRGVYHSPDGGATWAKLLTPRLGTSKNSTSVGIIDVAIDPLNSAYLVAWAWDHSSAAIPGNPGPSGPGSGLWRSDDTGKTWHRMDTVASSGLPNCYKTKLFGRGALLWTASIGKDNAADYLIAALVRRDTNPVTRYPTDENFQGLYRSVDQGLTWQKILDSTIKIPMGGVQGKDSANITNAQGGYDLYLAAGPSPALGQPRIYLGGIDIFESSSLGDSWRDITNSYSDYYAKGKRQQHSDQHGLAFTAATSGTDMLVVSDGGVFHTDDFGASWNQMTGLPITQFYAVAPWRGGMANTPATITARDLKVYGGTQDNGTVGLGLTSDTAFEWINGGDGTECVSHPTDSSKIISSLQFGVIFARNTLDSLTHVLPTSAKDTTHDTRPRWHTLTNRLLRGPMALTDTAEAAAWAVPVELDDQNPTDLYTARCHVYRATLDWNDLENTTWRTWSPTIGGHLKKDSAWYGGDIESIAIGVRDARGRPMLWAGGANDSTGQAIWRTTVDLARADTIPPRWISVTNGLPGSYMTSLIADRSDSLTAYATALYAGVAAHVVRTTDGGAHWVNISGNLPATAVSSLVIDTLAEHGDPLKKNQTLIAGTDVGVFVTTNGGSNWYGLGTGMPHIIVSDLKIYKNMLIAATHGRSLYAIDISDIQSGSRGVTAMNLMPSSDITIYPNPASTSFTIALPLASGTSCQCRLTNVATGNTVQLDPSALGNGSYRITPDGSLPNGVYVIELVSEGHALSRGRVSIIR